MKLFHARPPAVTPPNAPTFPALIVHAKGQKGLDRQGNPDPYRANLIDLSLADDPAGVACMIGGSPGAATLPGLDLADGDEVSILWMNRYPAAIPFKLQYGYGPMLYNAASGQLEDGPKTFGHDWTANRVYEIDYDEYVDYTPEAGQVFAYVNCTATDVCVYWDLHPRWPSGASAVATMVEQTAIVSGPEPDYIPYVANFEGYAWPLDWYWEWVEYNNIFDL